jgi:hypothetical protein
MAISATQALLKPWFDALSSVGITAPLHSTTTRPSSQPGSEFPPRRARLFLRQKWENAALFSIMFDVWKTSIDAGSFTLNFNFAPTLTAGGNPNNSVNPAFRNTAMHSIQSFG